MASLVVDKVDELTIGVAEEPIKRSAGNQSNRSLEGKEMSTADVERVADEKKVDGGGVKPEVADFDTGKIYPTEYPEKTYEDYSMRNDVTSKGYQAPSELPAQIQSILKPEIHREISKGVVRKKLSKMRHLIVKQAINPEYLDELMPKILEKFWPQQVVYNGGVANIKNWKISCYLEVMEGGVPCTNPCIPLLDDCSELLDAVDAIFTHWYKQQHACNKPGVPKRTEPYKVKRVMNFITRYTPNPNEQALLKHVDGAGKVDGSAVIALPVDRWTGPEEVMSFEGHGGGLTFWDGHPNPKKQQEIHYDTRSGDIGFIDKAVWHQADPITKGTRWAMVIFYEVV